jgi:hypothetical protein
MQNGLTISQALTLANSKEAPWIKKRRTISSKRVLYSVRSDFLVFYTEMWFRNRYPDTERVIDIMKSIEQEGEPDNRIYLAWINGVGKLMCFDGNHRREALIRLYHLKNFTCWIDLDILMNVDDKEVVKAFRRINLGVSVADIYIETNETDIPLEQTIVYRTEEFINTFRKKWKYVIVDKNKTRAPYCTKNNFIEIIQPYLNNPERLMDAFHIIHEDNIATIDINVKDYNCYIFLYGIKSVKKRLYELIGSHITIC